MHIGTVEINSQLALAPMAGVTDAAFRQICSELGAGYTITELISSKALCYHDKKTFSLLTQFPGEHPAAVQIFGSDPICMAEAAQIAMEYSGADILDINMGCPMGKIVNNGDGAALMKDPEKAGRIVEAVVKALPGIPVCDIPAHPPVFCLTHFQNLIRSVLLHPGYVLSGIFRSGTPQSSSSRFQ